MRYTDPDSLLDGRGDVPLYLWLHANTALMPTVERSRPTIPTTDSERSAVMRDNATIGRELHIPIPEPDTVPRDAADLGDCLRRRRSARDGFSRAAAPVSTALGFLAHAYRVSGEYRTKYGPVPLRTAPSAGALYPIEVYLVAAHVDGLAEGVYRYSVNEQVLAQHHIGSRAPELLREACGGQSHVDSAAGAILLSANFTQSVAKYGNRGYRYCLLEAGHIAQNFCLAAIPFGLAVLCRGAFYDQLANALVGVDGESRSVVYVLLFGLQDLTREHEEGGFVA
jgi:SagB-type dehydrogenase family enzyme